MEDSNPADRDRTNGYGTGNDDPPEDTRQRSKAPGKRDTHGDRTEPVPSEVQDVVDELSEAELRGLLGYVNARLAAEGDTTARAQGDTEGTTGAGTSSPGESKTAESATSTETGSQPGDIDEQPQEVPSKATRVVKEINDNRYYYWQWRDGDSVKSKYDGPVDSE